MAGSCFSPRIKLQLMLKKPVHFNLIEAILCTLSVSGITLSSKPPNPNMASHKPKTTSDSRSQHLGLPGFALHFNGQMYTNGAFWSWTKEILNFGSNAFRLYIATSRLHTFLYAAYINVWFLYVIASYYERYRITVQNETKWRKL